MSYSEQVHLLILVSDRLTLSVFIASQFELVAILQRLAEHFMAAAMSICQDRAFDAVCVTVMGCMAAIADCVVRKLAYDHPSEVRKRRTFFSFFSTIFALQMLLIRTL